MVYKPKLSDDEARELRIMRATMMLSFQALADMYEITETTAQVIVHGKRYRDAGGPIEEVGTVEHWTKRKHAAHGSTSMYASGCRCAVCSEANKIRCRKWRKKTGYGPRASRGVHRHT
jgi:hypothetical protein